MTPELRSRIAHRSRASRLRSDLTGLTVLTGLVATAGFGWLAAETYAGTPQTSKTPTTTSERSTFATPTPTDDQSTTSNGSTSNGSTSNGSISNGSSGSSSSGGFVSGNGGVSRSSGRGHITTGSS